MAKIPALIGKYRIESQIAQGGMGAVYLAKHPTLGRKVILKKLTVKGSSSIVERFKREARIMMDFKSDFIVDVYDHFKEGQSYYIVLEYINGISLDKLIKQQKRIPNIIALYIILGVCKALQYAHNKNVIHRDIKPANILISNSGEVKLVDFGIAVSQDDDNGLTIEGSTLGTPSYMAPEQLADSKNVDSRADVYSLGVMFYEMVTGKKPFYGYITAELIAAIQMGKYKKPKKLNKNLSSFIQKIIKKMMHNKSKKRYQDLNALIDRMHKRLKREKLDRLQEHLVALIKNRDVKQFEKKTKPPIIRHAPKIFSTILLLCFLSFLSIKTGFYQRFLTPNSHGKLRMELIHDSSQLLKGRYPVSVQFDFQSEEKKKTYKRNTVISVDDEKTGNYEVLYVKSGKYNVTIHFLSQTIFYNIEIEPFTKKKDELYIPVNLTQTKAKGIVLFPAAVDAVSNTDITDKVRLTIYNPSKKKWVNPNTFTLKYNTVYKVQFTGGGYSSGKFDIKVPKDVNKYVVYRSLKK